MELRTDSLACHNMTSIFKPSLDTEISNEFSYEKNRTSFFSVKTFLYTERFSYRIYCLEGVIVCYRLVLVVRFSPQRCTQFM